MLTKLCMQLVPECVDAEQKCSVHHWQHVKIKLRFVIMLGKQRIKKRWRYNVFYESAIIEIFKCLFYIF